MWVSGSPKIPNFFLKNMIYTLPPFFLKEEIFTVATKLKALAHILHCQDFRS